MITTLEQKPYNYSIANANNSLSNLTEAGENHFDNRYLTKEQAITFAKADDLDGIWHGTGTVVAQNKTLVQETSDTYNLSNWLPKDGNNYEILLDCKLLAPKANWGKNASVSVSSQIQADTYLACVSAMDTNYQNHTVGVINLPIGPDRKFTLSGHTGNTTIGASGTYNIYARGYRKIR